MHIHSYEYAHSQLSLCCRSSPVPVCLLSCHCVLCVCVFWCQRLKQIHESPLAHAPGHGGVQGRVKRAAAAFLYGGLCWFVRPSGCLGSQPANPNTGGVRTSPYLFSAEIGVTAAGLQRGSARHNWLRNDNKHSRGVVLANLLVFSQIRSLADNTGRLTRSVFRFYLFYFSRNMLLLHSLPSPRRTKAKSSRARSGPGSVLIASFHRLQIVGIGHHQWAASSDNK